MNNKYPHFVIKESSFFKEQHRFVGFYMPDDDVEKLYNFFPDGCNDSNLSIYSICYNGKSITDWIYEITSGGTIKRIKIFDEMRELEKKNQYLLWDWADLLHLGYHPMFDNNFKMVVGKGRIKPNKHTVIVLLDKPPKKVADLWIKLLIEFIYPMQDIIKKYIEE
jgi:hypothetical protein